MPMTRLHSVLPASGSMIAAYDRRTLSCTKTSPAATAVPIGVGSARALAVPCVTVQNPFPANSENQPGGGRAARRPPRSALGSYGALVYAAGMPVEEILIDARGHRCPVPTLRLRKALDDAPAGARVRLLADDPMARIDVPHFAAEVGAIILSRDDVAGWFSFLLAKP